MGEALLKQALPGREVSSAGVGALVGFPADPLAVEVMAARGVDISDHRARQASLAVLSAAELVLTLDQGHSDWINKQYPQLRGRVHKMLRWRDNQDVADPFRRPVEAFEQALKDIEMGVDDWVRKLR
jgi:protein-tyrosine phosphatase